MIMKNKAASFKPQAASENTASSASVFRSYTECARNYLTA
jgi:hypothetical protein